MIDISVIIPVYNPGHLIKRCLESIIDPLNPKTPPTPLLRGEVGTGDLKELTVEIICVDDGSTDESCEIIKEFQKTLSNSPCSGREDVSIVLVHQQNAGPSRARNRGLELARGRYVAFIDADDYWEPEFLSEMITFMDEHEECVAASCGQRHLTVSGSHEVNATCKEPVVLDDFFDYWADNMHVCTGSMIARREVLKSIGGMREDLRITEDLEFWALIATKGKWGLVPKVLFTSDGTGIISDKTSWLKKMQVRWSNAPVIENWQRRIIASQPSLENNDAYKKARGRISRNLTYCHVMSDRESSARKEAIMYGDYFPKDMWGKLMNICKHNSLSWWALCKFLQYRENNRFK